MKFWLLLLLILGYQLKDAIATALIPRAGGPHANPTKVANEIFHSSVRLQQASIRPNSFPPLFPTMSSAIRPQSHSNQPTITSTNARFTTNPTSTYSPNRVPLGSSKPSISTTKPTPSYGQFKTFPLGLILTSSIMLVGITAVLLGTWGRAFGKAHPMIRRKSSQRAGTIIIQHNV
ncbi:uncharacterized protein VTP21DRAFT_6669 [Calcarisporiella thermophila]|uniref:uncharacterized protein n=1 Tax=Calcarisporiella thermophila TaxID=911321 RepID=UPI003744A54E